MGERGGPVQGTGHGLGLLILFSVEAEPSAFQLVVYEHAAAEAAAPVVLDLVFGHSRCSSSTEKRHWRRLVKLIGFELWARPAEFLTYLHILRSIWNIVWHRKP